MCDSHFVLIIWMEIYCIQSLRFVETTNSYHSDSQYWHQQVESSSAAWKGPLCTADTQQLAVCLSIVTHMDSWSRWNCHSLFPKRFLPVLYVLYSAVKCTCKHCDVTSTAVLYFTGLRPCSFWVLWIYLTSQVIVKKQYRLYPPNSKFHDPPSSTVCHNWMTTTPTHYGNRGSSSVLLFFVYDRILVFSHFLNVVS